MGSVKDDYLKYVNNISGVHIYNEFKRILYTEEDSLVQTLNNNIFQYFPLIRKDCLAVCDIGGGDGKRVSHILKYLYAKF